MNNFSDLYKKNTSIMDDFKKVINIDNIPVFDKSVIEIDMGDGKIELSKNLIVGYIYENVDEKTMNEDFLNELVRIFNNYTILGFVMEKAIYEMNLVSFPRYNNRKGLYAILHIKECINNDDLIDKEDMFSEQHSCPRVRMSLNPRKNLATFIIPHRYLLMPLNLDNKNDGIQLVRYFFENQMTLPEDIEYVETLSVLSPDKRMLCYSKVFKEDCSDEFYCINKEQKS